MAIINFSAADFGVLALELAGYSDAMITKTSERTNNRRLEDFCGVGTQTLEQLFQDIQSPDLGDFRVKRPSPIEVVHALYFLKKYPTIYGLAARCNNGTEKTVLGKAWMYVGAIQALKEIKIRWIFDDDGNFDESSIVSVDGVHCRIQEPRTQPSSGWWSPKFGKAALSYEIGVATQHNKIVWVNGPSPAGQNDTKIPRGPNGLMGRIPDGRWAIGDGGYRGEPSKVPTKDTYNSDESKASSGRVRARHETVNPRLKAFGILDQVFRSKGSNRMARHKTAFEACCVVVQYGLGNGSPLPKA